jgi:hypothetical protein
MKKPSSFLAIATSFLALSLLSGCVQSIKMSKEQVSGIGRVGVVSIVQDKFVVKHVGTTVFTNSEKEFESPWRVNDDIKNAIKTELAAYPYVVVDLNYDAMKLQKHAYDKVNRFTLTYVNYDHEPIKEELKQIATDNALDTIILVTSNFGQDYIEHTNQTLKGYGLYKRSFLVFEKAHLYFLGMIKILNGRSMEQLALCPIGFHRKIEPTVWKEDFAMLSDEEKKSLETVLESGIKETTRKALARLGLIACNPDDYYCSAPVSEEK